MVVAARSLVLSLFCAAACCAQLITTIAGGGNPNSLGDNGQATAASLRSPADMTFDTAGNLYIADAGNARIRKVTPGGIITTVAGSSNSGFGGDNGPATLAMLRNPTSVALDSSGNLYIADAGNNRIRKVATNGMITTVAGTGDGNFYGDNGPAAKAALNNPLGVAVDRNGNLYIADNNNNRIRKVAPDGTISTVAGNGAGNSSGDDGLAKLAAVDHPTRLVLDPGGNLYVASSGSSGVCCVSNDARIRKVSPEGIISTVAGGGSADADDLPATLVKLNYIEGVAIDGTGNLYISDYWFHRVRKVTADGNIGTVAGIGKGGFFGDGGPATAAAFSFPRGVTVDAASNLYIADTGNNRIRKVYFPAVTATALTSSPNPSQYGQSVTLNATVSPSAATGLVSFKDGATLLGTGSLSGGKASFTLSTLPAGTHSLTATYNGDGNYAAGTSPALTQTVTPADTMTLLNSSANPSGAGQNLILTATVTPVTASGSVTFYDGGVALSSSPIDSGVAMLAVSTLSTGTHVLTAVYSGDTNYAASSSAPLTQTVNPASSTTTLTSSANPSASGQALTLIATVSPPAATGSVTFKDGQVTLASNPVSGGTATVTVSTLSPGTHSLSAIYSGDSNFITSSGALTQTVNGVIPSAPCTANFSYVIGQPPPPPIVCHFTAVLSASFTATTTASWLQVTPSSGLIDPSPAAFSLYVNPAGLAASPYNGSFTISGPQLGSLTVPVTLTVTSGQATLLATPTTLSFNYLQGSSAPAAQPLIVSSSNGAQLPFAVSASGGNWLIPGIAGGNSPVTFNVFTSPIGLDPNTYHGTLTISSPGVPSVSVAVDLIVSAPVPPQLGVTSAPVKLSAFRAGAPATTQIQVANTGGGVLNFTASTSGGGWLSVSPGSGSVDNSQSAAASPVSLTIAADPTSLNPGTYQGSVSVSGAGATASIPVTFSVADSKAVILVSQSGLSFTAVSQGGAPMPQQIGILNAGSGTLPWNATASTLAGGNWLLLDTSGGTVQQPFLDVSPVNVTVDPAVAAALDPGDYYGQIQVSGPGAVNSPQVITVILTVLPAGSDPGPEVHPSSLIFTGPPGGSPDPQNVMVGIRKTLGDQFVSSHIPGGPFTYSPAISDVQPNGPINIQVVPDFSSLNPLDIKRDTITLQFKDGTPRTISLLTVVGPDLSGSVKLTPKDSSGCTALNLQWRTPAPPGFTAVQGRGQSLELQVVDSCGNLIGPSNPKSASVTVAFGNRDPDLKLVHVGNGVWAGTWKPVNQSITPVTITATAFNSNAQGIQSGQSTTLNATVLPSTTPLVTAGGVQHAASYVLGAPIAPGTLITLKGLNLSDADSPTDGQPLPTFWNGTQVFMGTEPLPLLYTSSGQVNVQIPYDVPVNTQFQVTVQRDNVQSLPEQLVIAVAQPGIFTADASGTGQGSIYKSDGVTLAQPGTPATAGETVTIYCTGLGVVSPPVAAGAPPPSSPLSTTVNPVTVTIGGQDAKASLGTLVPGVPGRYQVNATVPSGVSGNAVPVVVMVAGQTSPAVTMAVQ